MTPFRHRRGRGGGGITAEAEIVISLEAAGIWISKTAAGLCAASTLSER